MFKLNRIALAVALVGSTLAGAAARADGPHGRHGGHHPSHHPGEGGYPGWGGHHPGHPGGGGHYPGHHHGGYPGWTGGGYPNSGWSNPGWTAPSVNPAARYCIPAEYSGMPAGYLINYGGANYITNADGTCPPTERGMRSDALGRGAASQDEEPPRRGGGTTRRGVFSRTPTSRHDSLRRPIPRRPAGAPDPVLRSRPGSGGGCRRRRKSRTSGRRRGARRSWERAVADRTTITSADNATPAVWLAVLVVDETPIRASRRSPCRV